MFPRPGAEALHRVAIRLDLDRAQLDRNALRVESGEVLARVGHPFRSRLDVEVDGQGIEPRIDAGAFPQEDVDVGSRQLDPAQH